MKQQEGQMTKATQSEPALSLNRRQLLTSTAVLAVTGIVPSYEQVEAANPAEVVSSAEIQTWNACAGTARKIAEIAKRNRIREEAGLPLLSIAKELRRMKKAEEEAEFEAFAAVHQMTVWDEVLAPERKRRGQPDWRPSTCMEGLAFQSRVSKILREQFKVARGLPERKRHAPQYRCRCTIRIRYAAGYSCLAMVPFVIVVKLVLVGYPFVQ
jgi:hypothetical protein